MVLSKYGLMSGVALAALMATPAVVAQDITSAIRGTVNDEAGNPVAGATVTITNESTGASRTLTTNASGAFQLRNLNVNNKYTVTASSNGANARTTNIGLSLGGSANVTLTLVSRDVEEISVTASAANVAQVALGPSSSFSFDEIQRLPSISRQIRDIIRVDPRVNIGRANGGNGFGVSCLGANNRFNSFTIDGVRAADGFGLNGSGNLARNTFPIPFDSVGSTAVEFAPVDVTYGQFTGCNINVTTKSGTNEFHGSAWFQYSGDSIAGDTIEDREVRTEPFDQYFWGADLGGPIVEDKLFFYTSYEEFETSSSQNSGPTGAGGFANELPITLGEANEIADILRQSYGRDPGFVVRNLPQTNRRFFGRIDWNINEQHRLAATYARLEESNLEGDNIGGDTFTFSDNFEQEGTSSDSWSVRLFSDWTDNFSTEIRFSRNEVTDNQGPLGGGEAQSDNPIPRIAVENADGDDIFLSGPGQFRSANALDYQINQVRVKGDYYTGNHRLTLGYELDRLSVFNLFVIDATSTLTFDSIDDLRNGIASDIRGNGSFSGDINDAAANFTRNIHSVYFQDEWQVTSDLTLTAGVRYDWYQSDDAPAESQAFVDRYGFSNSVGFNGLDAFMPRIGFTWDAAENTTVTGSFAIFSGGDPTVWFSNAFSNFGSGIGFGATFDPECTAADLQVLQNGQFTGVPACVGEAQRRRANAGTGRTDAIDANFNTPTQQVYSLGIDHTTDFGADNFFSDWRVALDFQIRDAVNAPDFVVLSATPRGTAPDGRVITAFVDPLLEGCGSNPAFVGIREGFINVGPNCLVGGAGVTVAGENGTRAGNQDIILTNDADGGGTTYNITAQISKTFQLTDTMEFDFRAGYSWVDATVGNPSTSSTSTSNVDEQALITLNQQSIAPSSFANEHNIVISANWSEQFFGDYRTQFNIFYRARSGRPFSYTFDGDTGEDFFGDMDDEERILLYVPTGIDDPLVDFTRLDAQGTTADFFAFLDETGLSQYAGGIAGRNQFEGPWNHDIDLRFSQELPGFFEGDRFEVFVNMQNFLNFLGSGTGVQRFPSRGSAAEAVPVIRADFNDAGQYEYFNFNPGGVDTSNNGFRADNVLIDLDDTLWQMTIGLRYEF